MCLWRSLDRFSVLGCSVFLCKIPPKAFCLQCWFCLGYVWPSSKNTVSKFASPVQPHTDPILDTHILEINCESICGGMTESSKLEWTTMMKGWVGKVYNRETTVPPNLYLNATFYLASGLDKPSVPSGLSHPTVHFAACFYSDHATYDFYIR